MCLVLNGKIFRQSIAIDSWGQNHMKQEEVVCILTFLLDNFSFRTKLGCDSLLSLSSFLFFFNSCSCKNSSRRKMRELERQIQNFPITWSISLLIELGLTWSISRLVEVSLEDDAISFPISYGLLFCFCRLTAYCNIRCELTGSGVWTVVSNNRSEQCNIFWIRCNSTWTIYKI